MAWTQLLFEFSRREVISPQDIKALEPMVHKFVNDLYRKISITDRAMEKEDLVQTAWMYVCEAANQYDPSRGAKLSTFVFLKLMTKFSNITRKQVNHTKKNTYSFSQMGNVRCLTHGDDYDSEQAGVQSEALMTSLWAEVISNDTAIDVKKFISTLTHDEELIAVQYFSLGMSQKEIRKANPNRSSAGIREDINTVRSMAEARFA